MPPRSLALAGEPQYRVPRTGGCLRRERDGDSVDQIQDLADDRLLQGCIHCGLGVEETRDHVPSRVLLEPPFPTNLPVVPACYACNNGLSRDEEYLACLIECAIAGSTDPDEIRRPSVANTLRRRPALRSRLEAAKSVIDGTVTFLAEEARVHNVLLKLARGHAAFELSRSVHREPTSLMWWPIAMMSEEQRAAFDASHVIQLFGEIGSRGMQRLLVTQATLRSPTGELSDLNVIVNDWVDVQEGRYRYVAIDDAGGVRIKIVLAEFLACEVSWMDTDVDET
jgi:hypothetical protein